MRAGYKKPLQPLIRRGGTLWTWHTASTRGPLVLFPKRLGTEKPEAHEFHKHEGLEDRVFLLETKKDFGLTSRLRVRIS